MKRPTLLSKRAWYSGAAIGALIGLAVLIVSSNRPAPQAIRPPPNLLFILTDDQRWDTMEVMPSTVASFPIAFSHAFVTTPLCCPSRSSILTGRYVHNTGVHSNSYVAFKGQEAESLGPWLQAKGYYTGFVGKYFNHYLLDDPVPVGWEEFDAFAWCGRMRCPGFDHYTSFTLREKWKRGGDVHDQLVTYPNPAYPEAYSTQVFSDLADRFIRRAADPSFNRGQKPWALFVWTNAPNGRAPESRHAHAPLPSWRKPLSFLEPDLSDKPRAIARTPYRDPDPRYHATTRTAQLRMLMSVDDMVRRLFRTLDETGQRSRTWGIFSSDNGRFWGEHWLSKKLYAYDEAIHVPLRVWLPGRGPAAFDQLVGNIDIAPTIMALAGDRADHDFDGRSFLGLLQGKHMEWRSALMLENWVRARYYAVRTLRWKLVCWYPSGDEELYELTSDPYELDNIAPERPGRVQEMREILTELYSESRGSAVDLAADDANMSRCSDA